MENYLYYIFSSFAVGGALGLLLSKNYVNATMSMLLSVLGMTGFLFLMEAYFLAFLMILIYAGAVIVLFLFVMMLIGDFTERVSHWNRLGVVFLWALMCAVLGFFAIQSKEFESVGIASSGILSGFKEYGMLLFSEYLLYIEIAGLILLSAMIGIIVIAGEKPVKRIKREML